MNLTVNSRLKLVPIEVCKDKKRFIVEDIATGEFYEMPEVCIDAIHLIINGKALGEIEKELKERYPDEEIGLVDFACQLVELGLVEELDGVKVELDVHKSKESLGFQWISPKLGQFFFNKVSMILYSILFVLNIILLISHPELFPHYKDLFIFRLMVLNIPAWLVITIILLLIHEFGHILAVRAWDIPTKLGVGHRLFLVVLETDMSPVWKLPSKDRNVLYLAGICFDTVMLFLSLATQLLIPNVSGVFLGILHVVVLDTFIRMVYQCCIYMKTDLYYVIENSSGCYNLMENAQQLIRKKLSFIKFSGTEEVIFDGERKTVFLYSIFYFIGVFLTVFLYILFYLPQLFYAFHKEIPKFEKTPRSLEFWDAVLFVLQITIIFGILLYSWRKKYSKKTMKS
jgi:putative peptide zinc metalloprotease protein